LNHSAQIELPPIRKGPVDAGRLPVTAVVVTRVPFTYSRTAVPSYVEAR
jgi:hypothetical protein